MRVLIAGWHGQVARALAEAAPGDPDIQALALGRAALDVRDPRSIERAFSGLEPTIVINSAAYTAVDQAETDADRAFALNAEGARLLARAAARRGLPMIHISTHYVFDGTKPSPYVEDDTPCPVTVFGRSKLAGEEAVAAENSKHVILRTGWVYSSQGTNFATRLMGIVPGSPTPLPIVADQHGNPTYAADLAAAILEIARKITKAGPEPASAPWGIYHAASSGRASWYEFASELLRQAGRSLDFVPVETSAYPTKAPRPLNSELATTKLASVFGVRLRPWQMAIADCLKRMSEV